MSSILLPILVLFVHSAFGCWVTTSFWNDCEANLVLLIDESLAYMTGEIDAILTHTKKKNKKNHLIFFLLGRVAPGVKHLNSD